MPNEFSVRLVPAKMAGVVSPNSPPTSISILYLTSPTVALTGGVKEGKLKKGPYLHFWDPSVQWWGQSRKLDNFLTT